MAYKDILVFLDATTDTPARLELAVSIAKAHGARLVGVDVSSQTAFAGQWHEMAVGLEDMFRGLLELSGLEGEFKVAGRQTPGWKDLYAPFADLIVAPQRDPKIAELILPAVPEDVLLSAGVPVLVLPRHWRPAPLGRRIVLAWTPSREATRAAHDALPFLQRAEQVTLFEFAPPHDAAESAPELMAHHLRHHGVSVDVVAWPPDRGGTPLSALFACLDRQGADMVVAGAYGHSRRLESLLGGASHDLLHQPVLPVLMSH